MAEPGCPGPRAPRMQPRPPTCFHRCWGATPPVFPYKGSSGPPAPAGVTVSHPPGTHPREATRLWTVTWPLCSTRSHREPVVDHEVTPVASPGPRGRRPKSATRLLEARGEAEGSAPCTPKKTEAPAVSRQASSSLGDVLPPDAEPGPRPWPGRIRLVRRRQWMLCWELQAGRVS